MRSSPRPAHCRSAGPPHGSTAGPSCPCSASRSCCSCCFPTAVFPPGAGGRCCGLRCVAPAVTTVLFALTPGRMTGAFAQLTSVRVINPTGIGGAGGVIPVLSQIGGLSSLLAAFLAGASLVARFRSRRGDERQQIKWLAFVGAAFLAELALTMGVGIPSARLRRGAGARQLDVRPDVPHARCRDPRRLRGGHPEVPPVRHRRRDQQDCGLRGACRVHHRGLHARGGRGRRSSRGRAGGPAWGCRSWRPRWSR